MIPIILDNLIKVPKSAFNLNINLKQFIHPNPRYYTNERLKFSNIGVPPEIPLFEINGDRVLFPRGLLKDVMSLRPYFEICDQTIVNPVHFNPSQIILKNYQIPACEALLSKNQGPLVAIPAAGKTFIMIENIIKRRQKSLVLVHTRDLAVQWCDRLKQFTDIKPGIIDADSYDLQDVTVALVQSLRKPLDASFLNQWGLVCLDECHHAPAYTFQQLINQFPARYRYGLTATPNRTDGLSFFLHAVFGSTLYRIRREGLFESGEIMKPTIRVIQTNFYNPRITDYRDLLEAVTRNAERNALITRSIIREAEAGHYCLVLSNRIGHAEWIAQTIAALRPDLGAEYLTSEVSKDKRTEIINMMNQGQIHIITATQLADEGLDLRRLDRLFLTNPVRSINKVSQQIGRIVRTFPGKKDAVVYDFRDILCSLAESQFQTRLKMVYEPSGYEVEEFPFIDGSNEECLEVGGAGDES